MDLIKDQRLTEIAQYLDISPSDFRMAHSRYSSVRDWLANGVYRSGKEPDIYLQGSFRLGTVIRPYRGDRDGDFDIDQVCELRIRGSTHGPEILKHDVGDRLKEHMDYERMLDDEGRRCWTLIYASRENRPGFHVDVLPAITSDQNETSQIDITDKASLGYTWALSDPNGYYRWFKSRNTFSEELVLSQRRDIFTKNRDLFTGIDDVPLQLVRSALQRGIQILKRHRDVYFAEREHKSISIIITSIAAHLYDGESVSALIKKLTTYAIKRHAVILKDGEIEYDGVLDYVNGSWSIPNPVHQHRVGREIENFADKWNEVPALATGFFDWVYQLDRDIERYEESEVSDDLNLRIRQFGEGELYSAFKTNEAREKLGSGTEGTNELLKLIHLGIEGKLAWEPIKEISVSIFNNTGDDGGSGKDVAKVNYYQIARHRRMTLSDEAKSDVRGILANNTNSAAFRMCCHLLLGSVTQEMIRDCIRQRGSDDVLRWPIMRLAKREYLLPE